MALHKGRDTQDAKSVHAHDPSVCEALCPHVMSFLFSLHAYMFVFVSVAPSEKESK